MIIFAWNSRNKAAVIRDKPFNELVAAGIQLKVEQSRKSFELTVLVVAALWGLIIAKKDEAKVVLSDAPECTMFVGANLLLIGSAAYHISYLSNIAYVYSLAGGIYDEKGPHTIPDVFESHLANPYNIQFWLLIGGIVNTALALFSAHKLKKS